MHHHSETEKQSILQKIWNVVFIFFYPIITTFSLFFVGLIYIFSSLSRLLSRISPSKETIIEMKKPEWESWATCESLEVKKLWVDEIMFGPSYYKLMTKPATTGVTSQYFGAFHFPCFGGLLLQRWNTTVPKELPDFDLVFLHGKTDDLQKIATIKAFSWNAEAKDEDMVALKWFTGTQGGEIEIRRKDLIPHQPLATD